MLKNLILRLSRFSVRHPRLTLLLAATLSVFAVLASLHLPVYTSRQALLPQNTPVADRLNQYLDTFGASSDLIITLEDAPRDILETFASDLAVELQGQPEIAQATARLDTEFLTRHLYLLLPPAALEGIAPLLEVAAKPPQHSFSSLLSSLSNTPPSLPGAQPDLGQTTQALNLTQAFLDEWVRWIEATNPDSLEPNLEQILKSVGAEQMAHGYFTSRDGRMLLVFVHARHKGEDFETLAPLNRRINESAETLRTRYRSAGKPAPTVTLTGLPAMEYEEYLDIEADIKLVIWSAALLIGTLIFVVVRSVPWALAIFIPMGLGALWSLGFAYLAVGHLTIITSSFLAILFGLGADYGIFTTSQIALARQAVSDLQDAIVKGVDDSFKAVATAGGASLLIFSTLATVEFPGFAELGVIAAGGVLLILISTWWVQPAIYILFPPKLNEKPKSSVAPKWATRKCPSKVAGLIGALALAGSLFGISKSREIAFDYDVLALLPKDSKAAAYQRRLVEETDYQSEVIIFTAETLEEIRRITDQASQLKSIAKVLSISSFFPDDQKKRVDEARRIGTLALRPSIESTLTQIQSESLSLDALKTLRALLERAREALDESQEQAFSAGQSTLVAQMEDIRTRLDLLIRLMAQNPEAARSGSEALLHALSGLARAGVNTLKTWSEATLLRPETLPPEVRQRFLAENGTFAAYAYPLKSVYDPENLDQLMDEVYSVSPAATGFPSTHQVFSKIVVQSFETGTRLAICACLGWLVLALRQPRAILMALFPLLIGGGWMLALMWKFGLRYNYANIIALPLVIALAVDYGVWLSHRWMSIDANKPGLLTLDAGRVILLAAGTELAGLGAITLASYRGVSGLGIDITIGLLTCLAATLIVTPLIGQLMGRNVPKR